MYIVLSIAAAAVGLILTGFAIFAAYLMSTKRRELRKALLRWTVFDYAIAGLFLIGTLFLFTDLLGVLRDREAYPYYHYGYLLSGFIYQLLAGIFLFVRLGLLLSGAPSTDDHERKPDET